jgi:hypothetical protein
MTRCDYQRGDADGPGEPDCWDEIPEHDGEAYAARVGSACHDPDSECPTLLKPVGGK